MLWENANVFGLMQQKMKDSKVISKIAIELVWPRKVCNSTWLLFDVISSHVHNKVAPQWLAGWNAQTFYIVLAIILF